MAFVQMEVESVKNVKLVNMVLIINALLVMTAHIKMRRARLSVILSKQGNTQPALQVM